MLLPRDDDNPFLVDESGDPKRDSLTQYDFGATAAPPAAEEFPGAQPVGAPVAPAAPAKPRMPAGYEPDDSCSQKCCHCSRSFFEKPLVVMVILVGLAASSIALFITSAIQSENVEAIGTCTSDCAFTGCARIVLEGNPSSCSDVCSATAYIDISPVRFVFTKFPNDVLSCGWTKHPDAWRMSLTSVGLLAIGASAWLVLKRKHGWMVWVTVISVVVAILTFISACVDANAARLGSKACNDGFKVRGPCAVRPPAGDPPRAAPPECDAVPRERHGRRGVPQLAIRLDGAVELPPLDPVGASREGAGGAGMDGAGHLAPDMHAGTNFDPHLITALIHTRVSPPRPSHPAPQGLMAYSMLVHRNLLDRELHE